MQIFAPAVRDESVEREWGRESFPPSMGVSPSTSLGGRMRDIKGSHPVSQDEGSTSLLLTPQSALHWKMQP